MNLNEEILKAQKECEETFAKHNQAIGKLNFLLELVERSKDQQKEKQD